MVAMSTEPAMVGLIQDMGYGCMASPTAAAETMALFSKGAIVCAV